MRRTTLTLIALALAGTAAAACTMTAQSDVVVVDAALKAAVAAPTRTPANVLRDSARHPAETLAFFGVKPTDTVVELFPSTGWYAEILAPYVKDSGAYYAAAPLPRGAGGVEKLKAANAALYGAIRVAGFPAKAGDATVPDGSADVVLTFRNVHNLRMNSLSAAEAAFAEMFRMLKPGGTLGVVDHRLPEGRDASAEEKSGYVKTSTVIALAQKAGFVLVAQSEINANPKDTADWAEGVWTLPPTYALKDVDRAKYAAIGESDRMTLKFRKP